MQFLHFYITAEVYVGGNFPYFFPAQRMVQEKFRKENREPHFISDILEHMPTFLGSASP
jgi:hypothetical protein